MKNKTILVPEKNQNITLALQRASDQLSSQVVQEPVLPEGWYDKLTSGFSDKQKQLIATWNLDISEDSVIFKSFASLYLSEVDAILIGNQFTSKVVFQYSILFFGESNLLSSAFICEVNDKLQIWADCAFNVTPTAEDLAKIAYYSADFYRLVTKSEPQVAFLSYSTLNSGSGKPINLVNEAMSIYNEINTRHYRYVGPLQFDSAFNPDIYYKKTGSHESSDFNVFIFPDLTSGNIAYKVANQCAEIPFYGPFVLGTDHVICDLSRAAKVHEIVKSLTFIDDFLKN